MRYTIFTKPWKDITINKLSELVLKLGFNGVELPIRTGYQVTPNNANKELSNANKIFKDNGLFIGSVAADINENIINIIGDNNIKILRVCIPIDMKIGYLKTEKLIKKQFDKMLPLLEKNNVCIGVQNHCDYMIGSAIGLMHLIENYDKNYISAVYDPAHCSIDGEPVDMGLDILYPHLSLVNFKSASNRRINVLTSNEAIWEVNWTTAKDSGYSWRLMVESLKQKKYDGDICLPAEYSHPTKNAQIMGDSVIPFVDYDLKYLKYLLSTDTSNLAKNKSTNWQSSKYSN